MKKNPQITRSFKNACTLALCAIALSFLTGSTIKGKTVTGDFQSAANVPALDSLHETIYILWHDAYAKKDYALIKSIIPRLNISVSKLASSTLPEMLHSKKDKWDMGIKTLQNNLSELQKAVKEDNKEAMLKTSELLHGSYENLVRTIRPALAELENFHQDLYKVYHAYMPENDIEKIKAIIPDMKVKIDLLKQAKLPQSKADRQIKFNEAVDRLEASLTELENSSKTNIKEKIHSAVDKLHTDYQSIDALLQ